MAARYITRKTATLYKGTDGQSRETVLIFGDEVKTSGQPQNKRVKVEFRDMKGYIGEDCLGTKPAMELYFIDVGQGDSTFIVTPARRKILIDGGINNRAFGFLAWKYRLDKGGAPVDIDLMVLSHADDDHIKGLIPIIRHPKINVKKVVHNGIATFGKGAFQTGIGDLDGKKQYLLTRHDGMEELEGLDLSESFESWRAAISGEGTQYAAVDTQTGPVDIGDPDVTIEVLGPRTDKHNGKPAYRWFKEEAHTINGHSVVLRLNYGKVSVLFSGDLNVEGSKNLLEDPEVEGRLSAQVFKAPHHGSHEFHLPFLDKVGPRISIISSGDDPDHGHPRASFIGAIGRISRSESPLVFSTEIAATFVEDRKKKPAVEEAKLENLDTRAPGADSEGRVRFKRRLHGMINVRTDGEFLYAARRVAAGYVWESYGPVEAEGD